MFWYRPPAHSIAVFVSRSKRQKLSPAILLVVFWALLASKWAFFALSKTLPFARFVKLHKLAYRSFPLRLSGIELNPLSCHIVYTNNGLFQAKHGNDHCLRKKDMARHTPRRGYSIPFLPGVHLVVASRECPFLVLFQKTNGLNGLNGRKPFFMRVSRLHLNGP